MTKAVVLTILSLFCAVPAAAEDVVVFAAASLKEPLDRITAEMDGVVVSYGGSGALARQVSLGAPTDVVILANADWMDVLVDGGHVQVESRVSLLSNRLVLLANNPTSVSLSQADISDALGDGRMAMGFTASVPAGIYGKAALMHLDLWDFVAPRVAEVDSVRAAVALVARGEAPLAVGYATDAGLVEGVYAVADFPTESHPPIQYTAAVTQDAGLDVLNALQSDHARSVFAGAGFLPVNAP